MRRRLEIRVCFEPTRLAQEQLQVGYEMVVPVCRARLRNNGDQKEREEKDRERSGRARQGCRAS